MNSKPINLLLADDDKDDCLLFKDALDELSLSVSFKEVNDGEQLMKELTTNDALPDVLFLDLNMPRKNGFECLEEIRLNERFNNVPIIIISTSLDPDIVNSLYKNGAQHYIRKPSKYSKLKEVIQNALFSINHSSGLTPSLESFVLQ